MGFLKFTGSMVLFSCYGLLALSFGRDALTVATNLLDGVGE